MFEDCIAIKARRVVHMREGVTREHNGVVQMKHRVPVKWLFVELCPGALDLTVRMEAAIRDGVTVDIPHPKESVVVVNSLRMTALHSMHWLDDGA